jgi:hypothetical protein
MMKKTTVTKTQALNEKYLKCIFEYNDLPFDNAYMGMV